jgi:hypothetical protein
MKPGTASNGIRIEQSPNTKEVGHPDGGGGKDD